MSCSTKSEVCCPISCAGLDLFPKQLILVKRCTPIRNICDGATEAVVFTAADTPSLQLPKGIISVVNTSTNCTMDVTVTDMSGANTYTLLPQSSVTVEVNELSSVTVICTGPNPADFCTGTFEADLQYTVLK
ncbi:S-Ena type endospore appendage [Paenibacillus sp. YYML68]|uniref:S-Ena type endospore appendage n=1 Tax=Paenibacillus sp. YYML68 TaxID=2909250 RepID=UPI002490F537|nr:S-Ena type endospore appendage [Paenibacillus sp. YYML68]